MIQDALPESRRALHVLLAQARMANSRCLRLCVRAILGSLHRFPGDRESIYQYVCLLEPISSLVLDV